MGATPQSLAFYSTNASGKAQITPHRERGRARRPDFKTQAIVNIFALWKKKQKKQKTSRGFWIGVTGSADKHPVIMLSALDGCSFCQLHSGSLFKSQLAAVRARRPSLLQLKRMCQSFDTAFTWMQSVLRDGTARAPSNTLMHKEAVLNVHSPSLLIHASPYRRVVFALLTW